MKACIKWAGTGEVAKHWEFDEHAAYGLQPGDLIELPDSDVMKVAAKKFQFTDSNLQPHLILWVWR